jgi:ubiquinone/menaquinone biosynthesis C-methylase UbiE
MLGATVTRVKCWYGFAKISYVNDGGIQMKSSEWQEQAQKKWDEMAGFWSENSEVMWESGSRKTIIPLFQRFVEATGDLPVLDAGCGDGYATFKLQQAGYNMIGIDFSERMVSQARNRGESERLKFLQADLMRLPFDDGSFSAGISINALEWTSDPLQALNELRRVIVRDGLLCLGILGPTAAPRKNSYPRLYGEPAVCNTMMPWECAQLCEENGWQIVGGEGVYKQGVAEQAIRTLDTDLKQALTFMWLFILRKRE